ncbi:MAG: hypothetical protein M1835_007255 [Candelina submexicana]|nr:MAG: hypothetical protein M1835_007255 [Candelina submexicana]
MKKPSFLLNGVPLEIREQIYHNVLSATPCKDVQFLRVCRQIYEEARSLLFKRPLTFVSQSDLYQWLHYVGPRNLHHVTSLSIKLLDIGTDACLRRRAHNQGRRTVSPKEHSKSIYEEDVTRLLKALSYLPSVKNLTIYKPEFGVSTWDPCRDLYLSLFSLVARQYNKLKRLSFFMDELPLTFLTSLQSLRSLRFTGFSTSTPAEALAALRSLPLLKEIELFGPPPQLDFKQRIGYAGARRVQSITPDVLLRLEPLESFTICEIRDEMAASPAFFSEDTFRALFKTHRRSLQRLRISLDFKPPETDVGAFARFVSSSSLQELEIGWPGLDDEVLQCLPSSLRQLQISISPNLKPDEAADGIIDLHDDVPLLKNVVLRLDRRIVMSDSLRDNLRSNFDNAISKLAAVGIRASRGWWHPILFDTIDVE